MRINPQKTKGMVKLAQSALHIITPGRPVTSVTCSTPWEVYRPTPVNTLQGATGNLSTTAISVYRQVLIYGLSEPMHHCRHP